MSVSWTIRTVNLETVPPSEKVLIKNWRVSRSNPRVKSVESWRLLLLLRLLRSVLRRVLIPLRDVNMSPVTLRRCSWSHLNCPLILRSPELVLHLFYELPTLHLLGPPLPRAVWYHTVVGYVYEEYSNYYQCQHLKDAPNWGRTFTAIAWILRPHI